MKKCWQCNQEHDEDAIFCPVDAALLATEQRIGVARFPGMQQVGTSIGPYALREFLHSGRRAEIFTAQNTENGNRCALKLLHRNIERAAAKLQQACQAEINATKKAAHQNVVKLLDSGVDDYDRPYIALELLESTSLEIYLSWIKKTLDLTKFESIFSDLLRTLAHIHDQGIVHGALSTQHILVSTVGKTKLIDFGKARDLKQLPDASVSKTNSREELSKCHYSDGSPESVLFSSPEQCMGSRPDERSDIYALACIMYLSLTGSPPFVGQNSMDTMQMHMSSKPKSLYETNPELKSFSKSRSSDWQKHEQLETMIFKAMEKVPDKRYQSATEMLEVFQTALHDGTARGA